MLVQCTLPVLPSEKICICTHLLVYFSFMHKGNMKTAGSSHQYAVFKTSKQKNSKTHSSDTCLPAFKDFHALGWVTAMPCSLAQGLMLCAGSTALAFLPWVLQKFGGISAITSLILSRNIWRGNAVSHSWGLEIDFNSSVASLLSFPEQGNDCSNKVLRVFLQLMSSASQTHCGSLGGRCDAAWFVYLHS